MAELTEYLEEQQRPPSGRDMPQAGNQEKLDKAVALLFNQPKPAEKPAPAEQPAAEPTAEAETPEQDVPEVVAEEVEPEVPAEPEPKGPPQDLKGLAEKLGCEVSDLYKLTFPAAEDGQAVTIGEAKDMLAERSDHTRQAAKLAEDRVGFENEMMTMRQELDFLFRSVPQEYIAQEAIDKANSARKVWLTGEAEKLRKAIPSWADEDVEDADKKLMSEHLAPYGFSQGDVDRIVDHRLYKYFRDNQQREARHKVLFADVKEVTPKPKGHKPGSPKGVEPPHLKRARLAKAADTQQEKRAAVAQLLHETGAVTHGDS